MTEALIFSDAHVHSFNYKKSRVPFSKARGLFNSRLIDTVKAMWQMAEYAVDNKIGLVWFCGDMFHTRKAVYNDEINLVYDCLLWMSTHGIQIHMIPGNHDYGDRDGNWNSIQPFDAIKNVTVNSNDVDVDIIQTRSGPDIRLVSVPYTDNPKIAKSRLEQAKNIAESFDDDKPQILLAHLGMQGAKVGSDYVLVSDGDISADDVPYKSFTACFFGHFHEHQKLFPNGWFVGALTQHNWSDTGGKRGFLHAKITKEKVTFKRIETNAPKFVDITEGEDYESPKPHDFVRYNTSQLITTEIVKELKEKLGVTHLDSRIIAGEEENVELSVDQLDPQSMLKEWMKLKDEEDNKWLLRIGEEILVEANEQAL